MRGRSLRGAMVVALLTTVVAAGCADGPPPGTDGALTDDWAKVAQVKGYAPEAGSCIRDRPGQYATRPSRDGEIDCASNHYGEAVHVGTFTTDTMPGPVQLATAYTECDAKSKGYLGRFWWEASLDLYVSVPTEAAWRGGARWFRCDVVQLFDVTGRWTARQGRLQGSVPADLLQGCLTAPEKGEVAAVPCTKAHNAEYVGAVRATATTPFPKSKRQFDVLHRQCRELIAKFVGVGKDQAGRFGTYLFPKDVVSWNGGNRLVRCAVWFDDKTMKKSARGTRGKGVPNF